MAQMGGTYGQSLRMTPVDQCRLPVRSMLSTWDMLAAAATDPEVHQLVASLHRLRLDLLDTCQHNHQQHEASSHMAYSQVLC
jgi:hypothetical protein